MQKIVRNVLIANIVLTLIFLYTNISLWNAVNGTPPYHIESHWSPIGIIASHYTLDNNGFTSVDQTLYSYFNTPFWIFWLLLIVNMYAVIKLGQRNKINVKQLET